MRLAQLKNSPTYPLEVIILSIMRMISDRRTF